MRTEPRIRLDPRFTHLVAVGDTVLLVGDDDPVVVEDALAGDVLTLLDGRRTAVDVAEALEERHPPETVHYVLLRLLRAGVIREVPTEVVLAAQGTGLAGALRRLWGSRRERPWVDVPAGTWQGPDGCLLRLTDDYLRPELADAVEAMGEGPVLLAGMGARRIWLGPALGPSASCPVCLQDRLRLNLTARTLVHVRDAQGGPGPRIVPLAAEIPPEAWPALAGNLPASPQEVSELVRTLRVIPLDPGGKSEGHPVLRLPHCPACGDPSRTVPGPDVALRSRPRSRASGGGYRIMEAEETLARYGHLVSPLTGVVRRIRPVPVEGTDLLHVYTASHAHHYGAGNVRTVKGDLRDHSGGKGRTDADARASALCESLERFSSVFRGDEPRRLARRSELGDDVLAPNELMHFSERQFAEREPWNRSLRGGFQKVPHPYGDQPIEWSPVRSLTTGGTCLVPAAFLYYGFRGPGHEYCDGDSNGLAAGNCLEEAILQGFLEVVERDAIALWWYNRVRRPGVELAAAGDSWIEQVAAYYRSIEREVWALDLTTDLGVPTYAALSALRSEREQDIIFGFGAHPDAAIALSRAFTELNQMLPTVLQTREVRRTRLLPDFTDAVRWWDEATLATESYLLPAAHLPSSHVGRSGEPHGAGPQAGDLRDDIQSCVERAGAAGCEVLVHDMTRPDVGFPVTKVIVPGLRHFWRRLGPGRLYDVPVVLGWIPRPLDEADLNPVSMFV